MIPALALIVGSYVITRMVQVLVKTEPKEHVAVVVCAVITIAVTLISLIDILTNAIDVTERLGGISGLSQ